MLWPTRIGRFCFNLASHFLKSNFSVLCRRSGFLPLEPQGLWEVQSGLIASAKDPPDNASNMIWSPVCCELEDLRRGEGEGDTNQIEKLRLCSSGAAECWPTLLVK